MESKSECQNRTSTLELHTNRLSIDRIDTDSPHFPATGLANVEIVEIVSNDGERNKEQSHGPTTPQK